MSGFTGVPGWITMRSTRPSVAAGIQRISSGTSVPRPRTCRTIGPRFTASIHSGSAFDGRRGGLQAGQPQGGEEEAEGAGGADDHAAALLAAQDFGRARDVHGAL